jgi:hypothetical protein
VKALNAVIPYGSLNEVDSPATAAEKWLWEKGIRGCFVLRGIEDNCMDECVNIIKNHTPKVFFYSWIDCQLETAFGEQIRRFCEAFYATPEIPFSPVKSVAGQGIVAQVGNDGEATCLRLVNDTPLSMRYTITSSAKRLHDRVYDKTLAGKNGGGALVLSTDISQSVGYNYEVTLLPFDIRIYSTEAAGDTFQISSTTNPAVIGPKGN